ncbi:MAG: hypothetical protein WC781_05190 [Candidatus Pacearchaeota archaeon]|jgi:hypothetical protein
MILGVVIFAFILIFSANTSAITGKIGNGRMILNTEVGEKIDRSILVINDNNITLNISLFPTGDLANSIIVNDKSFLLQPGEEKKAGFTIQSDKAGRYESKINVKFTPYQINESGVGLSAQIVLNVNEGNSSINWPIKIGEENKPIFILFASTILLVIAVLSLLYFAKKKKRSENGGGFYNLKSNGKKS